MGQKVIFSSASLIELIQATLSQGASFRFKVQGVSMLPFLKDGDVVILSPLSVSSPGLGKIAAFICPFNKRIVLHRIVAKKRNLYLFKGDNAFREDGVISQQNILGCVTSVERMNRNVTFGVGREGVIIAFCSRIGLIHLLFYSWRLIPGVLRKFIKCKILS